MFTGSFVERQGHETYLPRNRSFGSKSAATERQMQGLGSSEARKQLGLVVEPMPPRPNPGPARAHSHAHSPPHPGLLGCPVSRQCVHEVLHCSSRSPGRTPAHAWHVWSRRGMGSQHKVLTTPQDGFWLTANAMKTRLLPASPPTPALRPSWDGCQHGGRLRVYQGHVDRCPRESGSRPQPFPLRTKPEFESRSQGGELARPPPVITITTSTGDRSSGNKKSLEKRTGPQPSPQSRLPGPETRMGPSTGNGFLVCLHPLVLYFYPKPERVTKILKAMVHSCHFSHPFRAGKHQKSCGKATSQEISNPISQLQWSGVFAEILDKVLIPGYLAARISNSSQVHINHSKRQAKHFT